MSPVNAKNAERPTGKGRFDMTDFQEKQNENVSSDKTVKKFSFASFAKEILAVMAGLFFIAVILVKLHDLYSFGWNTAPINITGTLPGIIIVITMIAVVIAACSLLFAFFVRFCFNKLFTGELPGGIQRWVSYTFRFLMPAFLIFIFALVLFSPFHSRRDYRPFSIVNDLHHLRNAALMLRADGRDFIHEIPRGVNAVEYLKPHMNNPNWFRWSNDGPYIFIISGRHWWVGHDLASADRSLRRGLFRERGLFGSSQPEPPPFNDQAYLYGEGDTFIWVYVLKDDEDDENIE